MPPSRSLSRRPLSTLALVGLLALPACSGGDDVASDPEAAGASGEAGTATAGKSGAAGAQAGTAGQSGKGGSAGSGLAGTSGSSGHAGGAGSGQAGDPDHAHDAPMPCATGSRQTWLHASFA